MKKLFIVFVSLLLCLSSISFAGAFVPNEEEYIPPEPPVQVQPEKSSMQSVLQRGPVWGQAEFKPSAESIIKQAIDQIHPAPQQGMAAGLNGFYPSLSYRGINAEVEIGYSNRAGDQSGIISGSGIIWESKDRWTATKAGLSVFPGGAPAWGFFVGLEQYLAKNISISANLYPLKGGGQTIIGDATISGRMYF